MIYYSVKEYAAMIGKSDKTVYKMIDKEKIVSKKSAKGYKVGVDEQFIKVVKTLRKEIDRLQRELEGMVPVSHALAPTPSAPKKVLTKSVKKAPSKPAAKKSPASKSTPRPVKKKAVKKTPLRKSSTKKK